MTAPAPSGKHWAFLKQGEIMARPNDDGSGNPPGRFSAPPAPRSRARLIGIGAVAVAALLVLLDSWYTIDQGEIGVVLRNGALAGTADPGLHFRVPLIDSVAVISTRTERQTYEEVSSYSKDIQAANLKITVNYHVDASQAAHIYTNYGSIEGAVDRLVTPLVYSETKTVFGQYTAQSAISDRGKLITDIEEQIRSQLASSGIIVENVQLENIDFSEAFENSVEQRMLAEVDVAKRKQELEQEKIRADVVRTQAAAAADQTRAAAQAQADATRLQGEAEAGAVRAKGDALRDNPNLVSLITAERWNGVLPTTMVPGSTVPFLGVR